jgi:hypothetical protein
MFLCICMRYAQLVLLLHMENFIKAQTTLQGKTITVFNDYSLQVGNDPILTREYMQEVNDAFKGSNRIYKPMALLFWIDVKNNKLSNWK